MILSRSTGIALLLLGLVSAAPAHGGETLPELSVSRAIGGAPLSFVENRGQEDDRVVFSVTGRGTTIYLTERGLTFVLLDSISSSGPGRRSREIGKTNTVAGTIGGAWIAKLDFVGARSVRPVAADARPTVLNYFKGASRSWRTGVKTFGTTRYRDLWPGIDLVLSCTNNQIKQSFVVQPGADPKLIRLAYRGARSISVTPAGALEVVMPTRTMVDDNPVAWQAAGQESAKSREVEVAFVLDGPQPDGGLGYHFRVGEHDPGKQLVIDPALLVFAGFIGGSSDDLGYDVAVDTNGNIFVGGSTESSEATFPVAVGPDLTFAGGTRDGFVAKIDGASYTLAWAGYIGGTEYDEVFSIAVDSAGAVYAAGITTSTEATFPVSGGPGTTHSGSLDAFITKLSNDGTSVIYSGYIGGSAADLGRAVAVDSAGCAYIAGRTASDQTMGFPLVTGPDLTHNGMIDAFIAKVSADGTGLVFSGYIGGSADDDAFGIALDASNNSYLAGSTVSTQTTFPVMVGPDSTYNGGTEDAFITKVKSDGTGLVYSGYIGGSNTDYATDIAVDSSGAAYVVGSTRSDYTTFPQYGGFGPNYRGGGDGFVTKVKSDGTGYRYSGFYGGSAIDVVDAVTVNADGNAFVTGYTLSSESKFFPLILGPELTWDGWYDAFAARISTDGNDLDFSGYIGGSLDDSGRAIVLDAEDRVYIAGHTESNEVSFPVSGNLDQSHNGGEDVFVAQLDICGQSFRLNPDEWKLISLPCAPGTGATAEDLFSDDIFLTYDESWALVERDEANDSYNQLALTDTLEQGVGYWIKAVLGTWDFDVFGDNTNSLTDFDITLIDDADPGRWNLVGHPFVQDLAWADVKVVDTATSDEHLISETASGTFITNRTMYLWNGSSYQSYHPVSNPGNLSLFDGFWVRVKAGATLRIPAPSGGAKAALERRQVALLGPNEWWLQLEVTSDRYSDPGNRIGRLAVGTDGADEYDLEELPPFSAPYLTLVLPHPEWATSAWSYTTDLRQARAGAGGAWELEVRSDIPREITLSWNAEQSVAQQLLGRSRLVNVETAETVDPATAPEYTFMMASETHRLRWQVNSLPQLDAGNDRQALAGQSITLMVSFSDEDMGDTHTATVYWGDASNSPGTVDPQANTITAEHTFETPATYTVQICITDSFGATTCDQTELHVKEASIFADDFEDGNTGKWSSTVG
jgi:hypothetical protein